MENSSLNGKTILITGATNGLGKATALELAKLGGEVVIVGRNPQRIQTTLEQIRSQSGNAKVESILADLSSMAQVRRLAEEFKQNHQRLDVLVNNAGMHFMKRYETVDGYEKTLALNHLSYFLLTNLLMDRLIASAPSRVVNVASAAHLAARIDFEDIQNHHYDMLGFGAYGRSKLANVMFTYELARRLEGSGVTTNALHPGTVNTGFSKNNSQAIRLAMAIAAPFLLTPEEGAQTQIYLAAAPEIEDVTGKYFVRCQPARSSMVSYDVDAQKRLWRVSEELTGIRSIAGD